MAGYSPASNLNQGFANSDYSLANAKISQQQSFPIPPDYGLGGVAGTAAYSYPVPQAPAKSLKSDAITLRDQADRVSSLIAHLSYLLFTPTDTNGACNGLSKDMPDTVEANISLASYTLGSTLLSLEEIIAKIGGR